MEAGSRLWTTPDGESCIEARMAQAAGLEMRSCWTVTADSYLTHVPKALILEAVDEGVGATAAHRLAGSKKAVMVREAERLLQGTGWLPAMVRVPVADGSGPVEAEEPLATAA